jgi:hypothetical protein
MVGYQDYDSPLTGMVVYESGVVLAKQLSSGGSLLLHTRLGGSGRSMFYTQSDGVTAIVGHDQEFRSQLLSSTKLSAQINQLSFDGQRLFLVLSKTRLASYGVSSSGTLIWLGDQLFNKPVVAIASGPDDIFVAFNLSTGARLIRYDSNGTGHSMFNVSPDGLQPLSGYVSRVKGFQDFDSRIYFVSLDNDEVLISVAEGGLLGRLLRYKNQGTGSSMYYSRRDGVSPVSGSEAQFFATYRGYQDFSGCISRQSAAKNLIWAVRSNGSLSTVLKMERIQDPCRDIDFCHVVSPFGLDQNPGTFDSPWATLPFAASRVQPGATVYVFPGKYDVPVVTTINGTTSDRIRFVSVLRGGARINVNSGGFGWTNRADYINIEGFDISGNLSIGIANFASNVRILRNHVHDISVPNCDSSGGAGIDNANYRASNSEVIGNLVHDVGYKAPCYRAHAIYHSNAGGNILNNIVYHSGGWGIHLWHAPKDLRIGNNLVFENLSGGIVVGAGDKPFGAVAEGIVVTNNIVYSNSGWGICETGSVAPPGPTENTFTSNLIYRNKFGPCMLQNGKAAIGSILEAPLFRRYALDGTGNFRSATTSPAIDAGDPGLGAAIDYDGFRRWFGKGFDIGPFEQH